MIVIRSTEIVASELLMDLESDPYRVIPLPADSDTATAKKEGLLAEDEFMKRLMERVACMRGDTTEQKPLRVAAFNSFI